MSKFNFDNQPVPATPKTGHTFVYVDDVLKVLSSKDDTGAVTNYGSGGGPIPNLGQVLTAGNDGGAKKIINILDPTLAQDAATKAYVDGLIQPTPDLGAVLTVGNDAGAKKILNLLDPTLAQDAATKAYVDGLIPAVPVTGSASGTFLSGANVRLGSNAGANPLLANTDIALGGFLFNINDAGKKFFDIDPIAPNPQIRIGDTDSAFSGIRIFIDMDDEQVFIQNGAPNQFAYFGGPLSGGPIAIIGDVSNSFNSTKLLVSDNAKIISASSQAREMLKLDRVQDLYTMGDVSGGGNNSTIQVDDTVNKLVIATAAGGFKAIDPSFPGVGGAWLLGKQAAAVVALDATQYIAVIIDGVPYKLAIVN